MTAPLLDDNASHHEPPTSSSKDHVTSPASLESIKISMDQPSYDPPEAEHRDDHDEDIEDDDTEASEDEDKTCFTPRSGIPPADPDYYDYRSQITARTEFRAQQEVEIEVKPSIMDSPFPINNKPERHARRWSHNLVLLLTHLCVLGLMEEFVRHTVMGFLTDK
jgi:hypothetical protein